MSVSGAIMTRREEWELSGAEGETIFGVSDWLADEPAASVTLLHGLKGFSGYGMLPVIADRLARALPVVVHRFNASHSGMTRNEATFERPDLFARDTWNKQVADLRAVTRAARAGELPGIASGRRVINAGHSRGGVACLLSAGREGDREEKPDGVVTLGTPSWCASDVEAKRRELAETGRLALPSARTGQALCQGAGWLEEQLADPAGHDVLGLGARASAPALLVHGADDETIPARCAAELAAARPRGEALVIGGCDHVFNTAHPADVSTEPSAALAAAIGAMRRFIERVLGA